MLHELFHGLVQRKLGLAASELLNEHLDVMEGRYWLRLECRAPARALRESGAQRNTAVRDALAFRQERRMRYQGSAEKERACAQQPPTSPASDILTVMDFEEAARRVLSPAHWVDL